MGGIDRVADAALDFNADDEGVQQFGAAHGLIFGERQHGRCDGACGMDDGLEVGVVKVEHMAGNAVQQGGVHHVEMLATTQDGRLGGTSEGSQRGDGAVQRFMLRAADCATHPVQEGGDARLAHGCGNISEARAHNPAGERAGDFL